MDTLSTPEDNMHLTSFQGADPEFSSEGVQLSENLDKPKKKKEKKEVRKRRVVLVFPLLQTYRNRQKLSDFSTIIYIQVFFGRAWSFVQLQAPLYTNHKHKDYMVVLY